MDVKDYCKGMEMELTAWKAKLYDLTRKVDKLGTAEKEKILPNVEDLHMFVVEMGDRIEQLTVGVGLTQDGVARHGWRAVRSRRRCFHGCGARDFCRRGTREWRCVRPAIRVQCSNAGEC